MGIFDSAFDALGGTFADQWQDVITAGRFDEHSLVVHGVRRNSQNSRGSNHGAEDIISNGSLIYVPENTAAFIFSQAGIEQVITNPGGYGYRNGQASVFDKKDRDAKGVSSILLDEAAQRLGFSGMSPESKRVAFVNLREIRGLRFGTRGPLAYNDLYYGSDLEVYAYGTISVQVTDPTVLIRSFVPANLSDYSLDDQRARRQLMGEFLTSFISAVNALSSRCRISQLPSQATSLCKQICEDSDNAGTWPQRYGLRLASVAIENIEFTDESRELVRQFSERRMGVRAYEDVSDHAANVAAQQLIAQGVRDNGLGDGGAMVFGMNLASSLNPQNAAQVAAAASPSTNGGKDQAAAGPTEAAKPALSVDEQVETIKKLKELQEAGILTQEEFDIKKHQVLGI